MESSNVCDCDISGSNCGFRLSCLHGIVAIGKEESKTCGCGYKRPIRAKDVRKNHFTGSPSKTGSGDAYIYCENERGEGHVYYGTKDNCSAGNGLPAQEMEDNMKERDKKSGKPHAFIFERYSGCNKG